MSLKEAFDAQAAQEYSSEVATVARMYRSIVDNILSNPDVKDRASKIVSSAKEFADWLNKTAKQETTNQTEKSTELYTVKSLGNNRIGSYAVLWGDEGQRDLDQQFFTQKTEELTVIFDSVGVLPWMYQHAMDGTVKTKVAGIVDVLKPDSVGLWYEAQLKLKDEYDEYIQKLLEGGKLKTSSQTFPAAMEWNKKTGEITRWPIVEITGTPTPAEYRMPPIEFLKNAYTEVGANQAALDRFIETPREEPVQQGDEKLRLELELARLRLV